MNDTWVTIPCHRPYLPLLRECVSSVLAAGIPPTRILVIATDADAIRSNELPVANIAVHRYLGEWNMSKWWNLGLDIAAAASRGLPHEVLVLNADATVDGVAIYEMALHLRLHGCSMASPDRSGTRQLPHVMKELRPYPKAMNAAGCAFMLAGEHGLRCDTRLPGWFNDDDIEWQARAHSGVVIVPTAFVHHTDHGAGGEFKEEGLKVFREKWKSEPWI